MIVSAFIVCVIGGLGNLYGALAGAMLVGITKAMGVIYFPRLSMVQVLVCGAIIVTVSMGIRHGFGLWLQPVTQDRGWTRETFAFAIAIQNILGEVISSRLDGDVSYLAGDVAVLLSAASKGDGSVDVLTDIWLPNQSAAWAKYVTGGTRSLVPNKQPYLGVQGFYIPGYLQDKYGVKSVRKYNRVSGVAWRAVWARKSAFRSRCL